MSELNKMMKKEIDAFLQRKAVRIREIEDEKKAILEEINKCLKGRKAQYHSDVYVIEGIAGLYLGHYGNAVFNVRANGRKILKSGDLGQRILDFYIQPGKVIDP